MRIEDIRSYCLQKNAVTEEFPFDEVTLVFKVMGKVFALIDIDTVESINLKCDPEQAIELRAAFPEVVLPGWHMNKKHWNTIKINRETEADFIYTWIDHSYGEVVKKLSKRLQKELASS
jgi:predicted DNA-binding protein (MmcQ/YjbR family)